jgi:hypothetical protein
MNLRPLFLLRRSVAAGFVLIVGLAPVSASEAKDSGAVSFYDQIKPVLSVHCYKCHTGENPKGDLLLDSRKHAIAGGKSGEAVITPGASDRSALVGRITSDDPDEQMPPKGPRLTGDEVSQIRRWIDEGAKWPEQDDYWAFQRPKERVPPSISNEKNVRNPIDQFLTARLEQAGIKAQPEAEARILLRRVYVDLLGVPPSPSEAMLFLDDKSEDAFDRMVDRVLDDPRYGERWARHWLDLARYGESDGYEDDKIRPHAWRYRDYVIRSFNADKPYDRFVREQIAGDEIWPDDADAWIATGFARLGAWDGMSKEPEKQRQDFLNEATDAVGAVFLGVTLGCARCHDHATGLLSDAGLLRDCET